MKLIDLFTSKPETFLGSSPQSLPAGKALAATFEKLTGGNAFVADEIKNCTADTKGYFDARNDILSRRGLRYSPDTEPWLRVIAAVESAEAAGYIRELAPDCVPEEFAAALEGILTARGLHFSLKNTHFDAEKSPAVWSELFNQTAGQSGITLYFTELYNGCLVVGASNIADYAEAAEIASCFGLKITSRPAFGKE